MLGRTNRVNSPTSVDLQWDICRDQRSIPTSSSFSLIVLWTERFQIESEEGSSSFTVKQQLSTWHSYSEAWITNSWVGAIVRAKKPRDSWEERQTISRMQIRQIFGRDRPYHWTNCLANLATEWGQTAIIQFIIRTNEFSKRKKNTNMEQQFRKCLLDSSRGFSDGFRLHLDCFWVVLVEIVR